MDKVGSGSSGTKNGAQDISVLEWLKRRCYYLFSAGWLRSGKQVGEDRSEGIRYSVTEDIEISDVDRNTASLEAPLHDDTKVIGVWRVKESVLGISLFAIALFLYLVTRLVGLEQFPIYFFTDEAVHTILAESLVQNGFRYQGELLPAYFPFGSSFGLNSVSVYLQVVPYILFGKSVFVTRATSMFITLLGAAAVGLIVKEYFKRPYWWIATLILSITPTWFLHSRTAFENVLVASFYACFLYFYLRYRLESPRSLFLAIIFAALAFYSHGLGQFLIASTGLLLFISDFRYHWKHQSIVLGGILLVVVLLLPYFRFASNNTQAFVDQMRQRASYWSNSAMSLSDKIFTFVGEYFSGFNPFYWFNPRSNRDLTRHVMRGYGHLLLPSLVFFTWGFVLSLKRFRSPAYRTILIALIAAPVGAAMTEITILRTIWFVIPVTIIATVALSEMLEKIERRNISRNTLSVITFLFLAGVNLYMLRDALVSGPVWYPDYTLYGMQYGAKQLFGDAIPEMLEADTNIHIVVTPTWANGTDNFKQFFLSSEQQARVSFNSIDAYLYERLHTHENMVLILTSEEYQRATHDAKFNEVNIKRVVDYPDGTPGFYFVRLEYAANVDEIFASEREARSQLVETSVEIDDKTHIIRHSMLDMGEVWALFDGDPYTLIRGIEANPFIIDMYFQEPRPLTGLKADFANMDFTLNATLFDVTSGEQVDFSTTIRDVSGDPHVEISFDEAPILIDRLRLEILSYSHGERAHIHVRELELIP